MQIAWLYHGLCPAGTPRLDDDLSRSYQLEERLQGDTPSWIKRLATCNEADMYRFIQAYIRGTPSVSIDTEDGEYLEILGDVSILDVNAKFGSHQLSILHIVAIRGHITALSMLLAAHKEPHKFKELNINIQDVRGFSPAHHAALAGRKDVIAALRGSGADVMAVYNFRNGSALDLLGHCYPADNGVYADGCKIFHKYVIHPSLLIEDWVTPMTCEPNERQISLATKLQSQLPLPSALKYANGVIKANQMFEMAVPVALYAGLILPDAFAQSMGSHTYSIGMGGSLFVDGRHGSLLTRATLGHPNVMLDSVVSYKGLPQVIVGFSTRPIAYGEEIFWSSVEKTQDSFLDRDEACFKAFWRLFDIDLVQGSRAKYAIERTIESYIDTRDVEILHIFKNPQMLCFLLKERILTKEMCFGLFQEYERRVTRPVFDRQMGKMGPVTRNILAKLHDLDGAEVAAAHQLTYEMMKAANSVLETGNDQEMMEAMVGPLLKSALSDPSVGSEMSQIVQDGITLASALLGEMEGKPESMASDLFSDLLKGISGSVLPASKAGGATPSGDLTRDIMGLFHDLSRDPPSPASSSGAASSGQSTDVDEATKAMVARMCGMAWEDVIKGSK